MPRRDGRSKLRRGIRRAGRPKARKVARKANLTPLQMHAPKKRGGGMG